MRDLSIIIPARNEEWLGRTVQDMLENIEGDTEILVGLDGYWPEPGIPDDDRVRILHYPESIGQRAMQNRLAMLSTAKYVMKADAHTAWDKGFDVKMMNRMEDDITMVPVMRNLHVFDWVCKNCGMRTYQGPVPEFCRNEICDSAQDSGEGHAGLGFEKDVVWIPKTNPQSSAYRFNKNLQFKYFPELRAKLPREGLQETMSLQGSCFMATREKYWQLGLCDESWGSWGQQGSEVAIKTWLSGGRVLCNFDTWYGHLFRTQAGFSFPYPHSGKSQQRAREISQEIFLNDNWPKAIHPLSWLLQKFWGPLQDVSDQEARWELEDLERLQMNSVERSEKSIIFYTDNQLPVKFAHRIQDQIKSIGLPIVSTSLKPMAKMGRNIHLPGERGYKQMFLQILTALEAADSEYVFFCEHDVLYHPSHFDFTPPTKDKFYYNHNWWSVRADGKAVSWDANRVSQLCCSRELAVEFYRARIKEIEEQGFNRSYEPGRSGDQTASWKSEYPNIDVRHAGTLTKDKWSLADFRTQPVNFEESTVDQIPGWEGSLSGIL